MEVPTIYKACFSGHVRGYTRLKYGLKHGTGLPFYHPQEFPLNECLKRYPLIKLQKCLWKITIFFGKLTISTGPCSKAMLNYQKVYPTIKLR